MVRHYTRKTARTRNAEEFLLEAFNAIDNGQSIRSVAKEYGIPRQSLLRYAKQRCESSNTLDLNIGYTKQRQVFDNSQELELVKYIKQAANIYFGLSPRQIRHLAYNCAKSYGIKMPNSWEKDENAGADWFTGFLKRHADLAMRTPEATSYARASSFNRENVSTFFAKLNEVYNRTGLSASNVWNVDETGVCITQKPRQIVTSKGTKQVGAITSRDRGEQITFCTAVSATGNAIPPMLIFPRKNYKDHFVRDGPVGCIGTANGSGWMLENDFLVFIEHFVKHVRPTINNPVLLLLDNHSSHLGIDMLNYAKEHGVILLSFPPHCTHRMQPLDRSVYVPFKRHIASTQSTWMTAHGQPTRPLQRSTQ